MANTKTKTNKTPSFAVKESSKDKNYHKEWYDHIVRGSQWSAGGVMEIKHAMMHIQGRADPREYNHLLISNSGTEFPINFISFDDLSAILDHMVGEKKRAGSDFTIGATSSHAISEKHQALRRMETDFNLLPFYKENQDTYGQQLITDDMPTTKADLEEKKKNYKTECEEYYQLLLDYLVEKWQWERFEEAAVEDGFLGRAFFQSVLTPHGPKPEMLDNTIVIFDEQMKDPWGSDAKFIGILRYRPMAEAAAMWNLTKEQVKELEDKQGVLSGIGYQGSFFPAVLQSGNDFMVLEGHIEWKDVAFKKGRTGSNAAIEEFDFENEEKPGEGERGLTIENTRHCVVLGDELVVKHGLLENMVRTVDDWQESGFSIIPWLPRWKFGANKSYAEQLIPLSKLKNEAMHQLRTAFQRDFGKFVIVDEGQLPSDLNIMDFMYEASVGGAARIQSRKFGVNANYNQFTTVDLTIPQTTMIYYNIAQICAEAMANIVGMVPERVGGLSSPTQPVGNTEISMQQSTLKTERFFSGMNLFFEKALTLMLGQCKIDILKNPDRYLHIIGEKGIEYFKYDPNAAMVDVGVFVRSVSVSLKQQRMLEQMTMLAVQQKSLHYLDAAKALFDTNPREALKSLEQYRVQAEEEQRRMQQQQMMQQQQQMQQAQAQAQAADQKEMAMANATNQAGIQKAKIQASSEQLKEDKRNQTLLQTEGIKSKDRRLGNKSNEAIHWRNNVSNAAQKKSESKKE